MSQDSVTRRDFLRLGIEAVAVGAIIERVPETIALPVSASQAVPGTAVIPSGSGVGTPAEMAIAADWARSFGPASGAHPRTGGGGLLMDRLSVPFSFVYGDRKSADLLAGWEYSTTSRALDALRLESESTYTDPVTRLQVRVVTTTFKDFPAVESIVYFKNLGRSETPILKDIQALDTSLQCREGDPTIHYSRGATCSVNDFMPMTRILGERG